MAAELLDALAHLRPRGRMGERLRGLVHRTGLLGRGVEVSLPGDPDAAACATASAAAAAPLGAGLAPRTALRGSAAGDLA